MIVIQIPSPGVIFLSPTPVKYLINVIQNCNLKDFWSKHSKM